MAEPVVMSGQGRIQDECLEKRIEAKTKSLIEHAADFQSKTVMDVSTSLQDAARRTIEEHRPMNLSIRDSRAFAETFIDPQPVNDRLRDTVRMYREAAGV